MSKVMIPTGYQSFLNFRQTECAIKKVKDFFERDLAAQLNILRVSAPLFVSPESGLNDNLNGVERTVRFDLPGDKTLRSSNPLQSGKDTRFVCMISVRGKDCIRI